MRVPQNGGAGTGLSATTSDRAGMASGSVTSSVVRAWMRFFSGGSPTSAGSAPRAIATSGSMSARPSNASRAYRTSPSKIDARSSST